MIELDIHKLINKRNYIFNHPTFYIWKSSPSIIADYSNIHFFPTTSESIQVTDFFSLHAGKVCAEYIVFTNQLDECSAYYDDPLDPITYYTLPNSERKGVLAMKINTDKTLLVSSGQLSGCTAASLYIPDQRTLWFYHVGQNSSNPINRYDGKPIPYTIEEKNRDLYNAILECLNIRNRKKKKEGISDSELLALIEKILSEYQRFVLICIYSVIDDDAKHKPQKIVAKNGEVYLMKYNVGRKGFFLTSYSNPLFSQHIFLGSAELFNKQYSHKYRVDIEKK